MEWCFKRKVFINYRVRETINGKILWYLKDNGSEFNENKPGRKIIPSIMEHHK